MNNYPNADQYYINQNVNQNVNSEKNLNYNKCNYNQTNPVNLYDSYAGFIRGNMFPDLYNSYKISKPFDIQPMNEQAELLTYLDALSFAMTDLNLYLDNFPENRQMIDLFNQYKMEESKIMNEYESKYGPLFASSNNSNNWDWVRNPWPWENK